MRHLPQVVIVIVLIIQAQSLLGQIGMNKTTNSEKAHIRRVGLVHFSRVINHYFMAVD